ncbi:MAG: insulinase family protein [Candidatus Pacebacteria bacterium]|nr:insulinase family protein [Candidatus Paceibacterota bacterium]
MSERMRTGASAKHAFLLCGTYHGIEEYELKKNGLRVLYHYDDTAPVAGLMVTYLVGSRHEAVGYTGATHLLEHLMFKGSKQFPPKKGVSVLDQLSEKGALVNASTWLDRTNYYEVLPDEHFEFAVALEADRMRNAILTEKDRAEEMPAVRSEFAYGENNALEALDKHIWATAYMAHPYHHSTIGWQDDFEHVSIGRLQQFYDEYYWPNNAVVTVVGNIERERVLELLYTYFGVHPRSPEPIRLPYTKEPPQSGRRFVEVIRAGTRDLVCVAYKIPEGRHADMPALLTFGNVLAGGQTSRLHRSLVERRLCSSVQAVVMPFFDPSLLQFYATVASGVAHERVERAILQEIALVQSGGVTDAELARVQSGLETEMAFARDGLYALLSSLNEAIATGDWRFFFDLPRNVRRVTAQAVRDVAQRYLVPTTLTVGYYRGQSVETI